MKKFFVGVVLFGFGLFAGSLISGILINDPNAVDLFWLLVTNWGGLFLNVVGFIGIIACLVYEKVRGK